MPLDGFRFDRRLQVDITQNGSLIALRIEDLRVSFEVQKDYKTSANRGKFTIFGLAPATRGRIRELKDQIVVRAGYHGEELQELFHGDIVTVSHVRDGAQVATRIEANDGQTALSGNFTTLSYAEGASADRVLRDVLDAMKLPLKYLADFQDQKFLQGFSFAGPAREALDKVTARLGLEWSVQGGALKVLKRGGVDAATYPLISPGSGLVGSPERLQRLKEQDFEKTPPGWRIVSLLQPQVEPGGRVGLQSAEVPQPTPFRVETIQHQGDNYGEQWYSTIEVVDPGVEL